jgi:hypothetical protein
MVDIDLVPRVIDIDGRHRPGTSTDPAMQACEQMYNTANIKARSALA